MKLPKEFPKFQTVEWWIEQLQEFDPKAVVAVATGPGNTLALASVYNDNDEKIVWIDVEEVYE